MTEESLSENDGTYLPGPCNINTRASTSVFWFVPDGLEEKRRRVGGRSSSTGDRRLDKQAQQRQRDADRGVWGEEKTGGQRASSQDAGVMDEHEPLQCIGVLDARMLGCWDAGMLGLQQTGRL
jgi:hypothetical protein